MTDKPGEHPDPHADLAPRSPLLYDLEEGTVIYRLHKAGRDPIFFGRTGDNRFDAPDGSYGVLYAGEDEYCCFIEACGQVTGVPSVSGAYLDQRNRGEITVTQAMILIALSASAGLARIGADGRLIDGSHSAAQRWSAALRKHPTNPAGILYRARHDPAKLAFAIFECSVGVFQVHNKRLIARSEKPEVVRRDSGSLSIRCDRSLATINALEYIRTSDPVFRQSPLVMRTPGRHLKLD